MDLASTFASLVEGCSHIFVATRIVSDSGMWLFEGHMAQFVEYIASFIISHAPTQD